MIGVVGKEVKGKTQRRMFHRLGGGWEKWGPPVDLYGVELWSGTSEGAQGGTQSRKGYRLWPNCRGAVAVTSKNCQKGGAVQ